MVSENIASGSRLVMAAVTLMMDTDLVAVLSVGARSSVLRRWLWVRSMFLMELIL